MASHLSFLPALGTAPANKPAASKPAPREDDVFSSMVETRPASTQRSDKAAAQPASQNTPAAETRPAGSGKAPAAEKTTGSEAAIDPAVTEIPVEPDEAGGETSLSEALLAALTDVLAMPEGEGAESDLADVEEALDQLAAALGMDLPDLVRQLTSLVEAAGANGTAEGETDLAAKLTDWLARTLGTPLEEIDPEIRADLNRFIDAAKKWAQPLPSEPELAEPMLKLSEPVLTGKAAATATETAPAGDDAEKASTSRAAPEAALRDTRPADAGQNRPAQTPVASQNAGAPTDAAANMSVAQPAQAESAPLPTDSSAAAPRVVQSGYQTSQQQLNLPQIAFELARQVDGGNTRFQIRLDPPELGRIDVKLDIDSNGQVNARLTVEKAETLDLMQRDQRALERALQQAGLDANKTNLEFSLRQNPFAGERNEHADRDSGPGEFGEAGTDDTDAPPAVTLYRGALQASGLNIIA